MAQFACVDDPAAEKLADANHQVRDLDSVVTVQVAAAVSETDVLVAERKWQQVFRTMEDRDACAAGGHQLLQEMWFQDF